MPGNKKKDKRHRGSADHAERAYMGIRQMLFHNEITPGQKISYRDLAERLHMSSTPVIQALKFLEFQDLVRREPNRGYFAQPLSLQEVEEIYDLRIIIETSLLQDTFKNLTEEGLLELKEALDEHLAAARKCYEAPAFSETALNHDLVKDMEFHLVLASLSRRHLHQKVLRNLFDLLYLKYRGSVLFVKMKGDADAEHRQLFDAIVDRDLKRAKKALSSHISNVKRHVLAGIKLKMAEKADTVF